METENISHITGDDNKVIQGLTAGRDIVIKIEDNLPVKVKKQKKALGQRIEELVAQLSNLEKQSLEEQTPSFEVVEPKNPIYHQIK